jgi:hypothetical protein
MWECGLESCDWGYGRVAGLKKAGNLLTTWVTNNSKESGISGSHGGKYEAGCLLGCCAVLSGRSSPTFQRCLLPQSSGRWWSPEDSHLESNNVLRRVQIMQLLIILCSATSCHILPLVIGPVLRHLPLVWVTKFHSHTRRRVSICESLQFTCTSEYYDGNVLFI